MSERYSKLFSLPENLYSVGAPVVIMAGALLKDNQTGKVLVQLKITNISNNVIKSIIVSISQLDIIGKPQGETIKYQYLDLNIERDVSFGQKVPIVLPDITTRAFSVSVSEVIFADNTVWKNSLDGNWKALKHSDSIEHICHGDIELIKQFRLQYGASSHVLFTRDRDLWRCTCGALNHVEEVNCHICGNNASDLEKPIDIPALKIASDERVNLEKRKKRKRIFTAIIGIIIVFMVLIACTIAFRDTIMKTTQRNNNVDTLMTREEYISEVNRICNEIIIISSKYEYNINSSDATQVLEATKSMIVEIRPLYVDLGELKAPAEFEEQQSKIKDGCDASVEVLDLSVQLMEMEDADQSQEDIQSISERIAELSPKLSDLNTVLSEVRAA